MTSSITDHDAARLDDDGAPVVAARQSAQSDARLVWAPNDGGGPPSGAWWPETRNAVAELRALVPLVNHHLDGPVTRVSLNIDTWDADQPRRLRIGEHLVRLGWFHTLDPATVTLSCGSGPRVILHLVPPALNATEARELLREMAQ